MCVNRVCARACMYERPNKYKSTKLFGVSYAFSYPTGRDLCVSIHHPYDCLQPELTMISIAFYQQFIDNLF